MFCNQCGKQVQEKQQYCGICGTYVKKETLPIQSHETQFNFCRSCGTEIIGRYCERCGESSVQTQGKINKISSKIEQYKQSISGVQKDLKNNMPS